MSQKKSIALILIIILIAVVALVGANYLRTKTKNEQSQQNTKQGQYVVKEIQNPQDRRPDGFPKDIPVDLDTAVKGVEISIQKDVKQYTVVFKSNDTMDRLFTSYQKAFESAGYKVGSKIQQKHFANVFATKNGDDVSVLITEESGLRSVDVTYLDRQN